MSRTENYLIDNSWATWASKGAGRVVVSIAVSIGTSLLEISWIVDRPMTALAGLWGPVSSSAAVLVSVESHAGTHAGNGPAVVLHSQCSGANSVEVSVAASCGTVVFSTAPPETADRFHSDGKVVSVNKADVVVVESTMAGKSYFS